MNNHPYTIQMVERLIAFVPPLIPTEAVAELRVALKRADRGDGSLAELEEAAVAYGVKTWAHREAFGKLLEAYKAVLFEKLLLQKSSRAIKKAYEIFRASGGSWSELYKGGAVGILSSEARVELNHLFVDVKNEIKQFTAQAVASTERERYEMEINNFQILLRDMLAVIEDLATLARDADHATVAGEIRQFMKSFYHGLARIEVSISFDSLRRAREHFQGRKKEHHWLAHS